MHNWKCMWALGAVLWLAACSDDPVSPSCDTSTSTCVPLGGDCSAADVGCEEGQCVEGRCCESACDGVCQACGTDGRCNQVPANDTRCGVVACSDLDTTCRSYEDITENRCAGFGTCKQAQVDDCTDFSDAANTVECRAAMWPCDAPEMCMAGACPEHTNSGVCIHPSTSLNVTFRQSVDLSPSVFGGGGGYRYMLVSGPGSLLGSSYTATGFGTAIVRATDDTTFADFTITVSEYVLDFSTAVPADVMFTRASTGTRVNAAGCVVTEASDVARVDHRFGSADPLGLLIEEERTNFAENSEGVGFAEWVHFPNASFGIPPVVVENDAVAPDQVCVTSSPVSTAERVEFVDEQSQLITHNHNLDSGFDYTASVWMLGATGGEEVQVDFRSTQSNGITGEEFGLSTNWERYSVTKQFNPMPLPPSPWSGFQFRHNHHTPSAPQTDVAAWVWGTQLEQGDIPTSYIPTVAEDVTREADFAEIADLGFWNAASGTIYLEVRIPSQSDDVSHTIFSAFRSTDAANQQLQCERDAGNDRLECTVVIAGVPVTLIDGSAWGGGSHKIAFAFQAGDQALARDGSVVATGSASGVPTGIDRFFLGRSANDDNFLNGTIKTFRYWPNRRPDSELESLTTTL